MQTRVIQVDVTFDETKINIDRINEFVNSAIRAELELDEGVQSRAKFGQASLAYLMPK
jgi:hypothetical protein